MDVLWGHTRVLAGSQGLDLQADVPATMGGGDAMDMTNGGRGAVGLVDFSDLSLSGFGYPGSGEKHVERWHGEWYVFKFGSKPSRVSHGGAPMSEHLGCAIFRCCGVEAQQTVLGTYRGRPVVACRDFVRNGSGDVEFVAFRALENSTPGRATAEAVLAGHPWLEPIRGEAVRRFWETACVDALIANSCRGGSWGYLADRRTMGALKPAPVYGCDSCLHPWITESQMRAALLDRAVLAAHAAAFPGPRPAPGGGTPSFRDFLTSADGAEARCALVALYDRADWEAVHAAIDGCPGVDGVRADFYHELIDVRAEVLLVPGLRMGLAEAGRLPLRAPVSRPAVSRGCCS